MELTSYADISKAEFLTCKITRKTFNDTGNFGKHLKSLNLDYISYCHKFYYERIPKCLVSGLPSDSPVLGYFMKWSLISKPYKSLGRKVAANLTRLSKIPDIYKTKYLTYEYWMREEHYSLPESYQKIHSLVSSGLYKRLSDAYFDETWTVDGLLAYKQNLLLGCEVKLKTLFSVDGWLQRGWSVENARKKHAKYINDNLKSHFTLNYWSEKGYSHTDSVNKVAEVQKKNSNKRLKKYSKSQLRRFSPRCKEYWISKGYTNEQAMAAVSDVQSTFTLDKCIAKHGLELGTKVFEERQLKWQLSFINNNDIHEINLRKGKNLSERMLLYGELQAKKWFARRYWGVDITTVEDFAEVEKKILGGYTRKFYDKSYRLTILEAQSHTCGNPTCKRAHTDCVFDLHHIDYDKTNDSRNNLIFLCKSCHSKTTSTYNRQYWINFYSHINEVFCAKTI